MSNLLKKEIGFVPTRELNYRYCCLLEMPATTFKDMKEVIWIEDELRKRVIKAVGHDFYPPNY